MSRLSALLKRGDLREVLFWLLLLGSWQFLALPGSKNAVIGSIGAAAFLVVACASLDKLKRLGLDHARWRSVPRANWLIAVESGFIAGVTVFWIASVSGEEMILSTDRKLVLLQVTLGPVLEEIVFRGYLFAVLMWSFGRVAGRHRWDHWVVAIAALLFAAVHLSQPGVSWLQMACMTSTGTLYGWVRYFSGSAAPPAASHAVYNLTLYAMASLVAALPKACGA